MPVVHSPAVGTNISTIYLKLRARLAPEAVAEEVEKYWCDRGAELIGRCHEVLEPLSLSKTGRLGYAISEPDHGWLAIADSERYSADVGLARHLGTKLRTPVCCSVVSDVSQVYEDVHCGPSRSRPPAAFRFRDVCHDGIDEKERHLYRFLVFRGVEERLYDDVLRHVGPDELVLACEVCGCTRLWDIERGTQPIGKAVASSESADVAMARLGYQRLRDRTPGEPAIVLAAFDCASCGCGAIDWLELSFEGGRLPTSRRATPDASALRRAHWVSTSLRHEAARLTRLPVEAFGHHNPVDVLLDHLAREER